MKNFLYIVFALLLANCGKQQTAEELTPHMKDVDEEIIGVTKAQFVSAKMTPGTFEEKPFAEFVRSNGIINVPPQNRAIISACAGGFVKDLPVQVGAAIAKGQRIVTLENPEFIVLQQQYVELAEQLNYLKSEYERQQVMLNEKITSQKSFLKSESDYKSALARVNSLKKNLEMLNISPTAAANGLITSNAGISSPISGYVTNVWVIRGAYVSPSDPVMEVVNTDEILLELKVFEKDLMQVEKEQEILFRIPEVSKEIFQGTVTLIGTSIDSNSRMATVLGKIRNKENYNFSTGMFVEADIVTSEITYNAIPENAVVEFEGENYVLVLQKEENDSYQFLPMRVTVGTSHKGYVIIENDKDFGPDAKILTKGGFVLLKEGGGDH